MKTETKVLMTIALPMIVSQASDTVMLFADRLFLSYLGKSYIAASMSGGLTHFVFTSFFIGIVGYVNAIVAQYYGSGQKNQCASSTAQAMYLSLLCFPVLLAIIPPIKYFFQFVGHSSEQILLEFSYFRILMMGAVFTVMRNGLNGFFIGTGRTRVVMIANITGMIVNIPLNYIFIFGKFGFPAMGIEGAALGTICGSLTGLLLLALIYFSKKFHSEYKTRSRLRFSRNLMGRLLRFGFPAGTEMLLNVMAFNIFLQFMHSYGEDVAAAVTITFNWDLVAFVPMIGFSVATTARVGQHIGAGRLEEAKKTTFLALKFAYIYAGVMMCLFIFATSSLISVFTSGFAGNEGEVLSYARVMLRLASLYTLADASQLVLAGALRGAGDTKWVMWISVVLHWILALSSFFLIRYRILSPVGMWLFFIGFVISLGICMFLRFRSEKWKEIRLI